MQIDEDGAAAISCTVDRQNSELLKCELSPAQDSDVKVEDVCNPLYPGTLSTDRPEDHRRPGRSSMACRPCSADVPASLLDSDATE